MHRGLVLITLITTIIISVPGQAQEANRAGLVVQFPDGRVETSCLAFSEDEISGIDLLDRSNLPAIVDYSSGLGAKVCKIGDTGCDYPGEDCWCRCQGTPCAYWNYWLLKDNQWIYSPLGAGSRRLGNGDVDGWAWGDVQQPPQISLDEICPGEAKATPAFTSPLETPTPRPTAVPIPPPTATSPTSPLPPPPASPTTKVFIPGSTGRPPASKSSQPDVPPSPDRYVGFAGVLATLGLIVLTIWRRRKGV